MLSPLFLSLLPPEAAASSCLPQEVFPYPTPVNMVAADAPTGTALIRTTSSNSSFASGSGRRLEKWKEINNRWYINCGNGN